MELYVANVFCQTAIQQNNGGTKGVAVQMPRDPFTNSHLEANLPRHKCSRKSKVRIARWTGPKACNWLLGLVV